MHCIVGELCSTAADSSVWVFWYPYWPFQACLILSHYLCECTTKSIFFWISILWNIGIYLELSACVEWKNVIINGSLITSVTMSMGTFRTEPLFYSSGATDVHVRAAGYVSSSSKSATSSWIGGESLYIDTYILFSRIHSFIIYQISLTDCKVCIITCLTPSCSLFAPCSVVLAWFMIYAFCTEIIGALQETMNDHFPLCPDLTILGKRLENIDKLP